MTLELDNVHFAYPDKPEIFRGINLTIEANKVTALVGASGSGKSTLAALIARFWQLSEGSICVGRGNQKVDIASMEVEYWQQYISVVFQSNYMLNDTIGNNLRIACPDASDEELLRVCCLARLDSLLNKLPDGLNTEIGADGIHLSGGELQRLSIARALLKNAPLIILDEATASLDPENERDIQLAMQSLIANKTVLVIAHKLSSIEYADKIVVMNNGEIVEQGQHPQLLANRGLYHDLWTLQQSAQNWRLA